MPYLRYVL